MAARAHDLRDPGQWVNEPVRRALDGVLYRWLGLFCAPVVAAVAHKVAGDHPLGGAVHVLLPLFLCAYIGVHLIGRIWRNRGAPGGWRRAQEADRGTVAVARSIGWVALIGSALALIAPMGSLGDPQDFLKEVLLWFPLLFPLYALAVWATIDCAEHRLGRAVDESQRRFEAYWSGIGGRARPPSA